VSINDRERKMRGRERKGKGKGECGRGVKWEKEGIGRGRGGKGTPADFRYSLQYCPPQTLVLDLSAWTAWQGGEDNVEMEGGKGK